MLLTSISGTAAAADMRWLDPPDFTFEIESAKPAEGWTGVSDQAVERLRRQFVGAAGFFRDNGFNGPTTKVVENPGAYVVQVFPFARHGYNRLAPGHYAMRCGNEPDDPLKGWQWRPIGINGSRLAGDHWGFRLGITAAHELFHAVQDGYEAFPSLEGDKANCPPAWINEGTADALALAAAEHSGRLSFEQHGPRHRSILGSRPYYLPLSSEKPVAAYLSSSFWLYLRKVSTDWRFLDRMFETELPHRGAGPDGLRWLAQGLAAQDMPEIDVLYPHFIAWFATQGEKRYQYRGKAASWLDDLFDGCRELSINPVERSRSVTLSLAPVAARCVRLTYNGFSSGFEVSVGAQTSNPDQTDHIHLGLDGQLRWGSVAQGSGDGGEAFPALLKDYGKLWKILPAGTADGEPLELIFSNVAPVAGDTEPLEVTITAAAEDWRSKSLEQATADTAPEPADSSPGNGADADKTDKGQFTGSGEIEINLKADTNNCGGTGVVNDTLCRMPFRIVLTKSAYTSHMTGTYENVMEQGYEGTLNAIAEMQRLQQQPTADLRVDIRMPPIDHGAQGTYDAVIATKHPDHPEYDSVKSRMATLHAEKGATGRVTINEYTPHVLRGSFEGELYGSTHQDGRLRTISKPISGRFTIGAPILDDARVISTATTDEERRQGYHVLGFPHRAYGLRSRIHAMLDKKASGESGGMPGSGSFGQAGGGGAGTATGSSGAVMQAPSVGATEDHKENDNAGNDASSEKPDSEASRTMEDFEDAMTEKLKQALDQLPDKSRQAVEQLLNSE